MKRGLLGVLTGIYLVGQLFVSPRIITGDTETLSTEMPDGVQLNVHFKKTSPKESESDESNSNEAKPAKVLILMRNAYAMLTEDMGYNDWSEGRFDKIDLYLAEPGHETEFQGNTFQSNAAGLSPRFMVQEGENHAMTPVLMMPKQYGEYLMRWSELNGREAPALEEFESQLAGSIMHEMTHAVLFGYHENLGSTVSGQRHGDWYTEGLARYYETKAGSLAGFTDQGFRKHLEDKMVFSRGGANYFLKYHDENIFELRYENALFWLYFEKVFGHQKIVELTRRLADAPYDIEVRDYMRIFKGVTGQPFYRLLANYHNWIYREEYRMFDEGKGLNSPSRIDSSWNGRRRTGWQELSVDDVQPLTFQIHRIDLREDRYARSIHIKNVGFSNHVCLNAYLKTGERTVVREYHATLDEVITIDQLPYSLDSVDLVFSNLDDNHALRYEVSIR